VEELLFALMAVKELFLLVVVTMLNGIRPTSHRLVDGSVLEGRGITNDNLAPHRSLLRACPLTPCFFKLLENVADHLIHQRTRMRVLTRAISVTAKPFLVSAVVGGGHARRTNERKEGVVNSQARGSILASVRRVRGLCGGDSDRRLHHADTLVQIRRRRSLLYT
jgi:hypothetical protein